jgi:hypothetical protein
MRLDQIIDSSILDIFPLVPSTGTWPFTMIRIDRRELAGLDVDKLLVAPFQLLVLKRTDFNSKDLIEYATKSKEYQTILDPLKPGFLESYDKTIGNEENFQEWTDRTTNLAIGMVIQTALYKGLQFSSVETDLTILDAHMGLTNKNLRAYQLFDAHQVDPSALV